jgi:hypothetical protein
MIRRQALYWTVCLAFRTPCGPRQSTFLTFLSLPYFDNSTSPLTSLALPPVFPPPYSSSSMRRLQHQPFPLSTLTVSLFRHCPGSFLPRSYLALIALQLHPTLSPSSLASVLPRHACSRFVHCASCPPLTWSLCSGSFALSLVSPSLVTLSTYPVRLLLMPCPAYLCACLS